MSLRDRYLELKALEGFYNVKSSNLRNPTYDEGQFGYFGKELVSKLNDIKILIKI